MMLMHRLRAANYDGADRGESQIGVEEEDITLCMHGIGGP